MSRTAALLLVLFAVASGSALAAASAPIMVPRALNPPTLDGRLDDWPATPLMSLAGASDWNSSTVEYGGPEDISVDVRLAWDNTNLYAAIKTRDNKLVRVPSPNEIDRAGDSIVLGLAAEGAKESNEFAITLLSNGSPRVYRSEPASLAGEMQAVSCVIDPRADEGGGWRVVYELALPWSELSGLRPLAGEQIKFTVSASDDDGEGLKGFLEQSRLLKLTSSTAPVAGNLALPRAERPKAPAGFLVHGAQTLLFGGGLDYTRLSRSQWTDRLARAQALGMNLIGLSVVWSHHQPDLDKRDLSELRACLEAVAQTGLWAQVNVGPYTDEREECGGLPAWYFRLDGAARQRAADDWLRAVLALLKEFQASSGGPVVTVVARAVPEPNGWTAAASLAHLTTDVRAGGVNALLLTANAPAAPTLPGLLDSVSFYEPPSYADLGAGLRRLSAEQTGPAMISALPGAYATPREARRSADAVRVALARGAGGVMISDFARGADRADALRPGEAPTAGVIDLADFPTPGCGELRLIGDLLRLCGPQLARALPPEGEVARADDEEVKTAVRLSEKTGFIFLWNETGKARRQVRLTYSEPGTTTVVSIPASGAIEVPAGGAKILPLDLPVGAGTLRYATSEIAGLHPLDDRLLLVLYGDPDTPGEICLRWPGKPLVLGNVVSQEWDAPRKLLTLDYFHKAQDQYLMVDNLLIAVLSRARAAAAAQIGGDAPLTLSAGVEVRDAAVTRDRAQATLSTSQGAVKLTAAMPSAPSQVTLDGKPVTFDYTTPARVLELTVDTQTFEQEREPSSVWDRIGRSVVGGPPKLTASFDRALFLADREAPEVAWTQTGPLGRARETAGLQAGGFARFRARLDPGGRTTLALAGASDPTLAYVNGKLVAFDREAPDREADVSHLLLPGENEIALLVYLLPRAPGLAGLRRPEKRLPRVFFKGEGGELAPETWEVSPGLAGEAAGWPGLKSTTESWNTLRLGPWREQGRRYEDMVGVGWYRVPFGLAKRGAWQIPYQLRITISGRAQLYLNGAKLAALLGSGSYTLPLPNSLLIHGGDNVLVAAVYDPAGKGGLSKVEIASDESRMARTRQLEIVF